MKKEIISTTNAPAAVGPYSQAVKIGDFLYTSGQIALDPATGVLAPAEIEAQSEQVMKNLAAVLEAAGYTFDTAKHWKRAKYISRVQAVYIPHFRTTLQVPFRE